MTVFEFTIEGISSQTSNHQLLNGWKAALRAAATRQWLANTFPHERTAGNSEAREKVLAVVENGNGINMEDGDKKWV